MRHFGRVLGFGVALALLLSAINPSDVSAQKKKDKGKEKSYPSATDADYKSIQKQKEIYGTLVSLDTGALTLRVEYSHFEANPKYRPPNPKTATAAAKQQYQMWKTYNDLQVQMTKAATAKTPQQAVQIQNRINQDMLKLQQQYVQMYVQASNPPPVDPNNMPFITVTNTKDFDLELEEKVTYRRLVLPLEYDDTGNIKTYTKEEKAEMRGDDKNKPGYTAKYEDFAPGQEVKLSLVPPKKMEKDKDADKDKDKDDKTPEEVLRPTVKMVVMTKDNPNSTVSPGDDSKKKKKKDN
jgi:hypothetical protein